MGLSTTDLGNGGAGMPKTISPGNHKLRINSVELAPYTFIDGAYHLVLRTETEPIADFEGFLINKDNPAEGNYNGQLGKVKASQYAFADGETKTGIIIDRN
jgi:hypothetical protein